MGETDMARKFNELRDKMSPESRKRSHEKAQQLLGEMALEELREALSLTQEQLAESLGIKQASISKIVRGRDMFLSTLDKFIHAMGGELEIRAIFPHGQVKLNLRQFREAASTTRKAS
jgi:DNA-binding XRE family transcriptional regulator